MDVKNKKTKIGMLLMVIISAISLLVSVIYGISLNKEAHDNTGIVHYTPDDPVQILSSKGVLTIIGSDSGMVTALDPEMKTEWKYDCGNKILAIFQSDKYIYAASDDRNVHVLNNDGSFRMKVPITYRPLAVGSDNDGELLAVASNLNYAKSKLFVFNNAGEQLSDINLGAVPKFTFVTSDDKIICLKEDTSIDKFFPDGTEDVRVSINGIPVSASYNEILSELVVVDEYGVITLYDNELSELWSISSSENAKSIEFIRDEGEIAVLFENNDLAVYSHDGSLETEVSLERAARDITVNKLNDKIYLLDADDLLWRYDITLLTSLKTVLIWSEILKYLAVISGVALALSLLLFTKSRRDAASRLLKKLYQCRISYFMILPSVLLLIVFSYYPIIRGVTLAFTDYRPGQESHFIGLQNFFTMSQNLYFWVGLKNMLIFLLTDLIKLLIPSILFAELIFALRSDRSQYWVRVMMFLPGVIPGIAILLIWTNGILNQDGLLNALLDIIGLGRYATAWLGNENTAIWALVAIGFPWLGSYIIMYGAVNNLSNTVFDAAKIDGCGWLRRIVVIDIPLLKPQFRFLLVSGFIASIQNFALVHATTGGGPGYATYTPILELYFNMAKFQNYGLAAAMGLFMFVIIFGSTTLIMRVMRTPDLE